MGRIKTSLIVTVFNEQNSIREFIKSVVRQTTPPNELIIVDGGSTDNTLSIISNFQFPPRLASGRPISKLKVKILEKKGNRSVGRNEAIKHATGKIILCSDSGNVLDKNWVKNITKPLKDDSIDVVAGYYKAKTTSVFQKCLAPYTLVMPDRVVPSEFLPATRSVAFKKSIWRKIRGFPEEYSHNEDYVFANRLKRARAKIVFAKDAIVYWAPRKNFSESFIMFFRFAYGDGEAGIIRDRVLLIFARYLFYIYLIVLAVLIKAQTLFFLIIILPLAYIMWAITKNYKYVADAQAFLILPVLQVVSDVAVILGTTLGVIKSLAKINFARVVFKNYPFLILLFIYAATMLSIVSVGTPNMNHPFVYQMDEWHQAQSVRTVFKYGSPNVAGSANGTMFNFFITGIFLVPFYLFGIIDPFAIKSSVDSIFEQERLFIILRITTLLWGILTLIVIHKISKLLKLNAILPVSLVIFTPVWLIISNFFKYDIALTFWIVLSLYYFLKYGILTNLRSFLLASFFAGIAFATKVSALPLLLLIPLSYFLFTPMFKKKILILLIGLSLFFFNAVFLGFPDIVFGGKNMNEYLYENIVVSSQALSQYNLGQSLLGLTFLHKLPAVFGRVFYLVSIISFLYILVLAGKNLIDKKTSEFKIKLFLILSFLIFSASFITLGVYISANRLTVFLPFMVIFVAMSFKDRGLIKHNFALKTIFALLLIVFFLVQIFESYLWVAAKIRPSPQEISSSWILKNVPERSKIGLENIPIYQFEPDFILKEYYLKQYYPKIETKYAYYIVDKSAHILPEYMVLSNVEYEKKYLKSSPKNDLVSRLAREGYERIAYFPLKVPFYDYFDKDFYYPSLGLFSYPDGISVYEKK